jgi:hypothetical protein
MLDGVIDPALRHQVSGGRKPGPAGAPGSRDLGSPGSCAERSAGCPRDVSPTASAAWSPCSRRLRAAGDADIRSRDTVEPPARSRPASSVSAVRACCSPCVRPMEIGSMACSADPAVFLAA